MKLTLDLEVVYEHRNEDDDNICVCFSAMTRMS